jgi:hypothetical protein
MDKITQVLDAVEDYSKTHGILPSTVVRNATGNPRLHGRLLVRREKLDEDLAKIATYIKLDISTVGLFPDGLTDAGVPSSTDSGADQGQSVDSFDLPSAIPSPEALPNPAR